MAFARLKPTQDRNKVLFQISDWNQNQLLVLRVGTPANPGEIGPHLLPVTGLYETEVYKFQGSNKTKETGLDILQDRVTGNITIFKAAKSPRFDGVVFIESF